MHVCAEPPASLHTQALVYLILCTPALGPPAYPALITALVYILNTINTAFETHLHTLIEVTGYTSDVNYVH